MIETPAGTKSTVDDPFVELLDHIVGQALQAHQAAVITDAAALVSGIPPAELSRPARRDIEPAIPRR